MNFRKIIFAVMFLLSLQSLSSNTKRSKYVFLNYDLLYDFIENKKYSLSRKDYQEVKEYFYDYFLNVQKLSTRTARGYSTALASFLYGSDKKEMVYLRRFYNNGLLINSLMNLRDLIHKNSQNKGKMDESKFLMTTGDFWERARHLQRMINRLHSKFDDEERARRKRCRDQTCYNFRPRKKTRYQK